MGKSSWGGNWLIMDVHWGLGSRAGSRCFGLVMCIRSCHYVVRMDCTTRELQAKNGGDACSESWPGVERRLCQLMGETDAVQSLLDFGAKHLALLVTILVKIVTR